MSEVNPNDLVKRVAFNVRSARVIPTPLDPTLSHEGEAADAKATGDAIAGVFADATVNGKQAVGKAFTVYGTDIFLTNATGSPTIAVALESIGDKDASEIMYDAQNLVTIKDEIDGIKTDMDTEITTEEIDAIFDEVFGGDE